MFGILQVRETSNLKAAFAVILLPWADTTNRHSSLGRRERHLHEVAGSCLFGSSKCCTEPSKEPPLAHEELQITKRVTERKIGVVYSNICCTCCTVLAVWCVGSSEGCNDPHSWRQGAALLNKASFLGNRGLSLYMAPLQVGRVNVECQSTATGIVA